MSEGISMRIQVNVTTTVNSKNVVIDDKRNTITLKNVVPIRDDIVMNGGLYRGNDIESSYRTMEDTLAPVGHPVDRNGHYISATTGYAIQNFHGGAYNRNVTKKGGRVLMDIEIDLSEASGKRKGPSLVSAVKSMMKSGKPIHVSTGLLLNRVNSPGETESGQKYDWVASNMYFDHVAILLDEPGAARPDQGVGIFANSRGEAEGEVVFCNMENNEPHAKPSEDKRRLTANSMSFDVLREKVCDAAKRDANLSDGYIYVVEVWDGYFVYEQISDNGCAKLYMRNYDLVDGEVLLQDFPVMVDMVKSYTPKGLRADANNAYNHDKASNVPSPEGDSGEMKMKDKMIKLLLSANCGKSEDELNAMSDESLVELAGNQMTDDGSAKKAMLKGSMNEYMDKTDSEIKSMKEAVNEMKSGLKEMTQFFAEFKQGREANRENLIANAAKSTGRDASFFDGMNEEQIKAMMQSPASFSLNSSISGEQGGNAFQIADEGEPK